jgi:SAM-dependent methyltransferase
MTNRVEHAFYISDPADLKYFHNSRFDRIYFGNEFCEFLLPSVEQLANVLEFAARSGVEFTLMTPPCAENCLEKCERLIETLPANAEVVFNDWGLPQAIRDAGKTPVHGRLLCKAKKDPRLGVEGEPFSEYFTDNNLQSEYIELLFASGIGRAELDNVFQGLRVDSASGMKYSLYYPYVCCSATRKCHFANIAEGNIKFRTIDECPVSCSGENIPIHNLGAEIFMQGNAQYYVNDRMSASLADGPIDRLVYMPVFPNHNHTRRETLFLDWNRLFEVKEQRELWGDELDETLVEMVEDALKSATGGIHNALDIGCGEGRHAKLFAGLDYYGVDISPKALERAGKKNAGNFICSDILNLKGYVGFFDMAVDYGCFHSLPPWRRREYFETAGRIIKPGGFLIMCAWTGKGTSLPAFYVEGQLPEWSVSADDIEKAAEGLFDCVGKKSERRTQMSMLFATMKRI